MRPVLQRSILFVMLLCLRPAAAQEPVAPIVLLVNGDFTAYYQEPHPGLLESLTNDGGHRGLVLSPDGSRFAFNTLSPVTRAALSPDAAFAPGLPEDIAIITLASGERQNITQQPADAQFIGAGQPGRGWLRSLPAWSGDGSALIWAETALEDLSTSSLMWYNTVTRQVRLVDQLPLPPDSALPRLATADAGWIVHYTGSAGQSLFSLYTASGIRLNTIDLSAAAVVDWRLIDAPWQLLALDSEQPNGDITTTLIDLLSGRMSQPIGVSRLVAANDPQPAFFFYRVEDESGVVVGYQDMEQGRTYSQSLLQDVNTLALRPGGGAIAFATSVNSAPDSLMDLQILDGSETGELLSTDGRVQAVAWSPLRWQLEQSLTPCEGLPPRLRRGERAQVLPGTPNRLRDEPDTAAAQRGLLQGGTTVQVLGGPICDRQLVWWLVQYQDLVGWSAEGQSDTYFMQPINPS